MQTLLDEGARARLIETRRDLHRHPELAFQETRTAALVSERLRAAGYADVQTGVAGTGVVARLPGASSGKAVLLRADMDALPVREASQVDYRSAVDGCMHACGHDGHTAALLALAERLAPEAGQLPGEVRFCFQPAEEGAGGARRMIEEGVLDGVGAVFGVHLWNNLPVGEVAAAAGPILAAVDSFRITITGKGGHGALPHQTHDPVVAACQVVTALQTIVSRASDPFDAVVVTVAQVQAGDNFNVIPDTAVLTGTCRAFSREVHRALPGRVRAIAGGVAQALGCQAEVEYTVTCPPTVNDPACAALARQAAASVLGAERVHADGPGARAMVGEDFSEFLEQVPGCFLLVGSRNEARGLTHPHHSPRFDFDEDALPVVVRVLEASARLFLAGGGI